MNRETRWLDETVRVVARTAPPDLDWSRIEQGVFEHVDAEPPRRLVLVPEVPWRRLVAIAAVAAASILGLHHIAGSESTATESSPIQSRPSVASAPVTPPATDTGLQVGSRIHADQTASYRHQGWASFIVPAGSDVTVDRINDKVQLSLAAGSVSVAVTPGHQAGSFVVLVGNTAVAVHGTRFTVIRHASSVVVQVDEGVVSVGAPSRRGPTVRWLVGARSQGTFSLDGARDASFDTWAPRPATPVASAHPSTPAAADLPAADDDSASARSTDTSPKAVSPRDLAQAPEQPALPDRLTLATANEAVAPLLTQIYECYRQATSTAMAPGVKVTVQSSLSMTIAANGRVVSGQFDPPLKPDAQSCAMSAIHSTVFPHARHESKLQVDLQF